MNLAFLSAVFLPRRRNHLPYARHFVLNGKPPPVVKVRPVPQELRRQLLHKALFAARGRGRVARGRVCHRGTWREQRRRRSVAAAAADADAAVVATAALDPLDGNLESVSVGVVLAGVALVQLGTVVHEQVAVQGRGGVDVQHVEETAAEQEASDHWKINTVLVKRRPILGSRLSTAAAALALTH